MGSAVRALGRAARAARDRTLFAWRGFSSVDAIRTGSSAGEGGVSTGFGSVTVVIPRVPYSTAHQRLSGQGSTAAGWSEYLLSSGGLQWSAASSAPALVSAGAAIQLNPSDYGRVHVHLGWHTGSALRHSAFRHHLQGTAAITSYTAFNGGHRIGHNDTTAEPASACDIIAHGTWRGVPTDADLLALYDYIRANDGQLPGTFGALSMRYRWSLKRGVSGIATDGQVAPGIMYDESSGLGISRFGSTMQIRKLDVSHEGVRSLGTLGHTLADYFSGPASSFDGAAGAPWWIVVYPRFDALPGGPTARIIGKSDSITKGWRVLGHNSGAAFFNLFGSSEVNVGGAGAITSADLGVIQPMLCVYTGTVGRLYMRGVQVGTDVAVTYAPAPLESLLFGRDTSGNASVTSLFGFAAGFGLPTSDQLAAFWVGWQRNRRIAAIPGMTAAQHVDLTRDIEENGGPENGVPALALDRAGTAHLTRVGTGLAVAQRVEHVWSYESDPIVHGLKLPSLSDHYIGAARSEDPNGFMVELDFTLLALPGGAIRHILASRASSTTSGFNIVLNNVSLAFSIGNGVGSAVSSPSVTLSSAHVGRRLLFCGFFSAGDMKPRSYFARAQVGDGGTALAGPYVSSPNPLYLGRRNDGFAATDILYHGIRIGNFVPSLAEHQAAADRWAANDRMSLTDYAGRAFDAMYLPIESAAPAELSDLVGAAHLARVGSPTTAPLHARALGW